MDWTDLPPPSDLAAHFFCGPTFQQAENDCTIKTWCKSGTDQECPNGQSCFAYIEACEINALVKLEMELLSANSAAPTAAAEIVPTPKPTNRPLAETDSTNYNFCGFDWSDANAASNFIPLLLHCRHQRLAEMHQRMPPVPLPVSSEFVVSLFSHKKSIRLILRYPHRQIT